MATKKNPLSALLSSEERKQAEEFTRDHVTRSAVRQAGTYRVGVEKPIPISQTNLGRLSSSLGTVSGILNQFAQYQGNKEKAEMRGEAIEHQMTLSRVYNVASVSHLSGYHHTDVHQRRGLVQRNNPSMPSYSIISSDARLLKTATR